jgi:S1-C subfamily serine protease
MRGGEERQFKLNDTPLGIGALVVEAARGGDGGDACVEAGDVIVAIGDDLVRSADAARQLLRFRLPWDGDDCEVELRVIKGRV